MREVSRRQRGDLMPPPSGPPLEDWVGGILGALILLGGFAFLAWSWPR